MGILDKIASDKIDVFPSGFRAQKFVKSKLTTEENLTQLALLSSNKLNNNQIFENPYDNNKLIIYIKGYYFNIDKNAFPDAGELSNAYAFIRVAEKDDNSNIGPVLINAFTDGDEKLVLDRNAGDSKYEFLGLGFCTGRPEECVELAGLGTFESIQLCDRNGNLIIQNLKLDSIEIRANEKDDATKSIDEVFGTEKLRTKRITVRGNRSAGDILKIDNTFTVVDSNKEETEHTVDIDASLNVGSDQANGTVNLTSAGKGATTIIGPDGGQIKLPPNTASNNMIFIQNAGVPGWHEFSETNKANTIVRRDGNDIKTGTLNDIKFIRTQSSPIYKAEAVWGSVPLPDGSTVEMYLPTGNPVVYTPTYIKLASGSSAATILGKVDIEIDTQLDAPVKVKLSDQTGISVQYPGTTGASFTVKPGIININAQASDGKATGIGVNRAFINVGEECDLDFQVPLTVSKYEDTAGSNPATYGKISIGAGGSLGSIYVQAGKNVSLPADTQDDNQVFVQSKGVSGWRTYCAYGSSPSSLADTFMYRDAQGKSSVVGFTVSELAATNTSKYDNADGKNRTVLVDNTGKLLQKDLSVSNPTTPASSVDAPFDRTAATKVSFIHEITQNIDGQIVPTRRCIPYSSAEVAGIIRVKKVNNTSNFSDKLSATDIANRYYPLQITSDGFGMINVPWTDTTYKAGTCLAISTKAETATNGKLFTISHLNTTQKDNAESQTLNYGSTFKVYQGNYTPQGHFEGNTVTTLTLPQNLNSAHSHVAINGNPVVITDNSKANGTEGTVGYSLAEKHTNGLSNDPTVANTSVNQLNYDGKFSIPMITVNKYGLVESITSVAMQLPSRHTANDLNVAQMDVTTDTAYSNTDFPILCSSLSQSGFAALPSRNRVGDSYVSSKISANPVSGKLTCYSLTQTSDRRLKENIRPFNYNKSILDLEVKKFDFINGSKDQIGCMAQDLMELYPELVVKDSNGYLSIHESKLVYLLLEEVKILRDKLQAIENSLK